jgi:large subunit ribosomal protein L22
MEALSIVRYLRISPKKLQQVVGHIKGLDVPEAVLFTKFLSKGSSVPIGKAITSAAANLRVKAEDLNLSDEDMYVKDIYVDKGPDLKRYRPRAYGRASLIRKRTSHLTVIVAQRENKER